MATQVTIREVNDNFQRTKAVINRQSSSDTIRRTMIVLQNFVTQARTIQTKTEKKLTQVTAAAKPLLALNTGDSPDTFRQTLLVLQEMKNFSVSEISEAKKFVKNAEAYLNTVEAHVRNRETCKEKTIAFLKNSGLPAFLGGAVVAGFVLVGRAVGGF